MPETADLEYRVLREQLAAVEHERWAHWQKWMHSACVVNLDGSLTIPAELVRRWEKQIATPYAHLSEREQVSDREQVDRYWPLIAAEVAALRQQLDEARGDVERYRGWLLTANDTINALSGELEAVQHELGARGWLIQQAEAERERLLDVYRAAEAWRDWWATLRPEGGMFAPENGLAAAVDRARRAGAPAEAPQSDDDREAERRHAEATRPTDGRAYSWKRGRWVLIPEGDPDTAEAPDGERA